ncbi:MAG: three-Cys-motif partner protein TcmP, partial [Ferrovibrionaceae bacterium]
QGVPSFTYCPADQTTPLLFSLQRPLEELAGMLLSDFAGQTLTMEEIYEFHHIDKRYIERNYKDALMKLEAEGKIVCVPSAAGRRKHTFAKHVRVQFP